MENIVTRTGGGLYEQIITKEIKSQKNTNLYATYRRVGIDFPDFGITRAQTTQNSYIKEMKNKVGDFIDCISKVTHLGQPETGETSIHQQNEPFF